PATATCAPITGCRCTLPPACPAPRSWRWRRSRCARAWRSPRTTPPSTAARCRSTSGGLPRGWTTRIPARAFPRRLAPRTRAALALARAEVRVISGRAGLGVVGVRQHADTGRLGRVRLLECGLPVLEDVDALLDPAVL